MQYVDLKWTSYNMLRRNNETKQEQVRNLYATGLCEGPEGAEFCFLPTRELEFLENEINNLFPKIRTENHEISLCNEIFYTSKIEGANTTFQRTQQIHDGKPVDMNNYFSEKMVESGFNATKFLNVHGNRINEPILLEMWRILTDGACQNEDIKGDKYRTGNVGVGSHMGLHFSLIEDAMKDWIDFYNSSNLNDHPFLKAALLHFVFEYIHPFCDGNGRAGRLLMVNYLIGQGYDACKAVSFSRSIEKNRAAYDAAFVQAENSYSDVTPFLEYMLAIFADAFYDVLEKYPEKDDFESEDKDEI